jgi:hypothetical protein
MSPTRRVPGTSAVKSRRSGPGLRVRARHGGAPIRPRLAAAQSRLAHQVRDQPDRALDALPVQLRGHPPAPICAPAGIEDPQHMGGQLAAPRCGRRLGLVPSGVETGSGHAQQPAHPRDRVVRLLRIDHRAPLGYRCSRAKKAAVFFRNSFSIRSRRTSSSSSCTRALSTGVTG